MDQQINIPVLVTAVFRTKYYADQHQVTLAILGSHENFGSWDQSNPLFAQYAGNNVWEAHVSLPPGETVDWKWLVYNKDVKTVCRWEECKNHSLLIPNASITVDAPWNGDQVVKTIWPDTQDEVETSEEELCSFTYLPPQRYGTGSFTSPLAALDATPVSVKEKTSGSSQSHSPVQNLGHVEELARCIAPKLHPVHLSQTPSTASNHVETVAGVMASNMKVIAKDMKDTSCNNGSMFTRVLRRHGWVICGLPLAFLVASSAAYCIQKV